MGVSLVAEIEDRSSIKPGTAYLRSGKLYLRKNNELSMQKSIALAASRQMVLWIVANAGGVGKTTLGIHLGYRLAQLGLNILFIDLDTNGSLARFCNLELELDPQQTTAALFDRKFSGKYPIRSPKWGKPTTNFHEMGLKPIDSVQSKINTLYKASHLKQSAN